MGNKILWSILLLFLTASCLDEPDCYQLNNHIVGISFNKLENGTADTVAVSAFGAVDPPILFWGDTTITRLFLPLNYFQEETAFFFDIEGSVRLLQLGYVSQVQFVSEDCGEKFVISKLRLLDAAFDSVRLVTDTPTRDGSTINIEIYQ